MEVPSSLYLYGDADDVDYFNNSVTLLIALIKAVMIPHLMKTLFFCHFISMTIDSAARLFLAHTSRYIGEEHGPFCSGMSNRNELAAIEKI